MAGRIERLILEERREYETRRSLRRWRRKPIPLAVLFRDPGFNRAEFDAIREELEREWQRSKPIVANAME